MIKLKRCPFCGGEAKVIDTNVYHDKAKRVRCTVCGAYTGAELVDHPEIKFAGLDESTRYTEQQAAEKAAERWNRRDGDDVQ